MQKQNDAAMREQMIKLGLDPSEIAAASTYDDPVLAEIERDMLRGGGGAGMDDEAAMLAELEREINANLPNPRAKAEELRAKIA